MGCGISMIDAEDLASEQESVDVHPNSPSKHTGDENGKDNDHVRFHGRRSISSPIMKMRIAKGRHSNANHREPPEKQKGAPRKHKEDDEEGSCDSEEARKITFRDDHILNCPGSPSFREYCINYEPILCNNYDDNIDEATKLAGKDADVSSGHGKRRTRTNTEKKGRRGRAIRLVLPRRASHHE